MRPTGANVLVVDDDPAICETLGFALADSFVVHAVGSGREACAILQTRPIAAIILDAVLGREHGLDLVERFRTLSLAPVLVLTGHSSEQLALRALRARVDGYLRKPFNLHELRAALARLTGQRPSANPVADRPWVPATSPVPRSAERFWSRREQAGTQSGGVVQAEWRGGGNWGMVGMD